MPHYAVCFLLLCVGAATLTTVVNGQDYCAASLCRSGSHIACNNKGAWSSSCPTEAKIVAFTEAMKNVLVKAHNDKRHLVAGGGVSYLKRACRMATMTWNDELAKLATLNVRQCAMKHDSCRNTNTYLYSGQNLAWIGFAGALNATAMLEKSAQMWYNEVKDVNQSLIDAYPTAYNGPAIGHFTVMVADRNVQMGCGACQYPVAGKDYDAFLLACNYATTNVVTKALYKSCAKAAAECKMGTNPQLPNLCSTKEQYSVNSF